MEVVRDKMRVHISGLQGLHPIRTGIAYWYRGHYMYGTSGVPIVQLPFATKGKLHISGAKIETAPEYGKDGTRLVPESAIGALDRAVWMEWRDSAEAQVSEELDEEESLRTLAESKSAPASIAPGQVQEHQGLYGIAPAPSSSPSPSFTPGTDYMNASGQERLAQKIDNEASSMYSQSVISNQRAQNNQFSHSNRHYHTPHGRALFLAVSAPGSRIASRNVSRAGSPLGSRAPSPSYMDPRAHVRQRLVRFAEEDFIARSENPWQDGRNSERHPTTTRQHLIENVPESTAEYMGTDAFSFHLDPPPRSSSVIPFTHTLPGLQQSRDSYDNGILRRSMSSDNYRALAETSLRGKAKVALNEAYNEAYNMANLTKCALHGEECDGKTVTNAHLTEQARKTRGFKDLYPIIERGEGVMIDWIKILHEEKAVKVAEDMVKKSRYFD